MDENTKKILIFSTNYLPNIGGAELAIKHVTDNLDDVEFDLIAARMDKDLPARENIGNINVFRVGRGNKWDKLLLPLYGLNLASKLHQRDDYDLIFSSMASYGGETARRFKMKYPAVPFLLNLQEGRDFSSTFFLRDYVFKKIINAADIIVVISDFLKHVAIRNGVKKEKIQLIPNGVDIKNFSREFNYAELSKLNDDLGIKPDEKVIISASRLTSKNGIDILIEAFSILVNHWQGGRYKLILAGDGPLKEKLSALAKELEVEDRISFLGTVTQEDLPRYFAISNVFVRPSRSEGLGSAFLEAMAGGLPVIATPVGGIIDF